MTFRIELNYVAKVMKYCGHFEECCDITCKSSVNWSKLGSGFAAPFILLEPRNQALWSDNRVQSSMFNLFHTVWKKLTRLDP